MDINDLTIPGCSYFIIPRPSSDLPRGGDDIISITYREIIIATGRIVDDVVAVAEFEGTAAAAAVVNGIVTVAQNHYVGNATKTQTNYILAIPQGNFVARAIGSDGVIITAAGRDDGICKWRRMQDINSRRWRTHRNRWSWNYRNCNYWSAYNWWGINMYWNWARWNIWWNWSAYRSRDIRREAGWRIHRSMINRNRRRAIRRRVTRIYRRMIIIRIAGVRRHIGITGTRWVGI